MRSVGPDLGQAQPQPSDNLIWPCGPLLCAREDSGARVSHPQPCGEDPFPKMFLARLFGVFCGR